MGLTDIPQPQTTQVERGALVIREIMANVLSHADSAMLHVRSIIRDNGPNGRAAIAAELGDDAADLLAVYNSLKAAVETGKKITIEDVPD